MQKLTMLAFAGALLAGTTGTSWTAAPPRGGDALRRNDEMRQKYDRRREGNLKVGDLAPDFAVQDLQGQTTVRLSELRGKPVVLIFGSCT
jgi:cytochrome oxidase Cu insertion factor (SCO1/SenC/PrrC family)